MGVEKRVSLFRTDGPGSGLITRFRTDRAHSGLTKTYAIEHPGERTYLLTCITPDRFESSCGFTAGMSMCRFGRSIDHSPIPPRPIHTLPRQGEHQAPTPPPPTPTQRPHPTERRRETPSSTSAQTKPTATQHSPTARPPRTETRETRKQTQETNTTHGEEGGSKTRKVGPTRKRAHVGKMH